MTLFILDILITNLTYILTGKYFLNKLLKIDQQDAIKSAIFGIGVISFIFGAISITTTNGGIGVYPLSISMALSFYGLPLETSLAFGWILWTSQTIMVIFFGLCAFFLLPIVNNKI